MRWEEWTMVREGDSVVRWWSKLYRGGASLDGVGCLANQRLTVSAVQHCPGSGIRHRASQWSTPMEHKRFPHRACPMFSNYCICP